MIDGCFKLMIFIGMLGVTYLIGYGIITLIEQRKRKERQKLKARAERYTAIDKLRCEATYHEWILRNRQIKAGKYILTSGKEIKEEMKK